MQQQRWESLYEFVRLFPLGLFLLSFRIIGLPLYFMAVILERRVGRRNPWVIGLRVAFLLSFFSPVDVNLLGHYRSGGVHPSGPRLVVCVVGMPAHTSLISRYGEYYAMGCAGYTGISPHWMLVLR